jgi:Raf kinase inhibitor-like YbhB/YbcL family protein
MSTKRHQLAAALTLAIGFFAAPANADGIFTLKSATFQDGRIMPKKVANSQANRPEIPSCVGDNASPELSWSNLPGGTKSLVLFMTDSEGRGGAGTVHWVGYGIPASVAGFAEGEVSGPSDKYVGGRSTMGVGTYSGPCPSANSTPHHYVFILMATDLEPKELPPGMTKDEVAAKLVPPSPAASHVKGTTGLVGLFVTPWRAE